MAINHFKMRNDVISYAIHGMGCSASAIAINACRDALLCHPKKNPIGIVISFENLTMNFYYGKERGMLVTNALFRLGAAAMLFGREPTMTVPRGPTLNATYKLDHLVRTHLGSSDEAYRCIWQEEDKDGAKGVRLSKDVPKIAGKVLTINVTKLAHLILPYHELIRFGIKMAICKLTGQKPGAPNFLTAVDHVCIHAGGRGVIDAIEKDFNFPEHITKPSREILYYYGNQSSASIWYIFKHIHPNVTRGQKVWQMTFGSGFKANSLVWKRL
jgi:3-ketoacyl-CoA synthase